MITIYAPNETDFSTLGLGALAPYECVIEEQAGGMYELTMSHPMDEDGKWLNIGVGCIIKAPAPVRESPLVEAGDEDTTEPDTQPVTVVRKIYRVRTNTGANLNMRSKPSTASNSKVLGRYKPGTLGGRRGRSAGMEAGHCLRKWRHRIHGGRIPPVRAR